jgi:uncharacterized integral membrane protein
MVVSLTIIIIIIIFISINPDTVRMWKSHNYNKQYNVQSHCSLKHM